MRVQRHHSDDVASPSVTRWAGRASSFESEHATLLTGRTARAQSWFSAPISTTPGPSRYIKHHQEGGTFGFWTSVCFTINFIMGSGFLGVPLAFAEAGIATGVAGMIMFTVISNYTKNFLLSTMARAEAMEALKLTRQGLMEPPKFHITLRKFEIVELVEMFLGRFAKTVYLIMLWLFQAGALWGYASVFSASFAANIPIPGIHDSTTCNVDSDFDGCSQLYRIYVGIFALIVLPLSCTELKEQRALQVAMSIGRFLIIALLVGTVLGALPCDGGDNVAFLHRDTSKPSPALFQVAGLRLLVPVCVYAQIFHQAVPLLSQPVKDKSKLAYVFGGAFTVTGVFYCGIGILLAWYFGTNVNGQCNLMWKDYVGCSSDGKPTWWAEVIRFFVLVFPALDVMSAFPLNAITLGNNAMSAWAGDAITKVEKENVWTKRFFRLLAAIPPLTGAFLVSKLDSIIAWVGLIGFFVAFFVPCALNFVSRRRVLEEFHRIKSPDTIYKSVGEVNGLTDVLIGVMMVGVLVFVMVYLVLEATGNISSAP